MNSRRISVREQNEVKEKIDLMNTKYIPLLDKMLRLGSKNQQLNPGENEFLSKYITVLIKRRSLLERSQGHCWRSMDDLIRWERQLVVLMNCPNLMAAAQLPVDAMSSRGTIIGGQNEINEKFDLMKKKYVPLLDKMLNGLGSTIQRLKLDDSEVLLVYKTVLEKARTRLQIPLRGHYQLDDLLRWEKGLVAYMNVPNLMVAFRLPGGQLPQLQIPQLKQYGNNQINTLLDQQSKPGYHLSSLPKDGKLGQTLVSSSFQQGQAIDNSTSVISDSSSIEKFPHLECNQGGGTAAMSKPDKSVSITPIERLLKAVQTSSSKALRAAVKDIYSVVSMSDVFAGSHPGVEGTKSSFPEDLVSTTRCRVEHGNSDIINDVVQKNFKRQYSIKSSFSGWPLDYDEKKGCKTVNDFGSSEELKSGATSGIKKSRLETNHALLEEVRKINLVLVNSKLYVSGEGTSLMSDAGESVEGTIVKCTFSPMYCSSSTKKFPALPMWFLIPAKYPHCSPVLLDSFNAYQSHDYAYENLLLEAMDKFYASINCISVPISLEDMATSWDSSANAVFSEYARRMEK